MDMFGVGGGRGGGAALDIMHLLLLNLGLQVFLVGQNVPVPLGDGLLLAHPDLLGHLDGRDKNHVLVRLDDAITAQILPFSIQ